MYDTLKSLVLPPASLLCVLAIGLVLALIGRRRLGWVILFLGTSLFYALCTPYMAYRLNAPLETIPALPDDAARGSNAQAIVVLSGGFLAAAPEYGEDVVDHITLQRLRYAAHLQRVTGLPVLTSGGRLDRAKLSLAEMMKHALEADFGVPVMWTEDQSADTYENAVKSAAILKPAGISRVLLVTHAAHMARSVAMFTAAGFDVVPAPTDFLPPLRMTVRDFAPSLGAFADSFYGIYELIGARWYAWRHPTPQP